MKRITALATHYAGVKYRSRTEARWACFFDAAGIRHRYEFEGFDLRTGYYLPDFWLPELKMFFEVKGEEPTADEVAKCEALVEATEANMLLAPGPPEETAELHLFMHGIGQMRDRYVLARDRFSDFGFWLVALPDWEQTQWIGPTRVMTGARGGPMFSGALQEAYATAKSARFERGDGKVRVRPIVETDPARVVVETAGKDAA